MSEVTQANYDALLDLYAEAIDERDTLGKKCLLLEEIVEHLREELEAANQPVDGVFDDSEPPKDGSVIEACWNICWHDEASGRSSVETQEGQIQWKDDCWVYADSGMSVIFQFGEKIVFHEWSVVNKAVGVERAELQEADLKKQLQHESRRAILAENKTLSLVVLIQDVTAVMSQASMRGHLDHGLCEMLPRLQDAAYPMGQTEGGE